MKILRSRSTTFLSNNIVTTEEQRVKGKVKNVVCPADPSAETDMPMCHKHIMIRSK